MVVRIKAENTRRWCDKSCMEESHVQCVVLYVILYIDVQISDLGAKICINYPGHDGVCVLSNQMFIKKHACTYSLAQWYNQSFSCTQ